LLSSLELFNVISVELNPAAKLVCSFMALHEENCQTAPFSGVSMMSAADYVSSLQIPGNFNWRKAIRTILVKMKLGFILPATEFIGPAPDPTKTVDPLAIIGGSDLAFMMLRDALSPLHLYAVGRFSKCHHNLDLCGKSAPCCCSPLILTSSVSIVY
jgi:hypothetical protein